MSFSGRKLSGIVRWGMSSMFSPKRVHGSNLISLCLISGVNHTGWELGLWRTFGTKRSIQLKMTVLRNSHMKLTLSLIINSKVKICYILIHVLPVCFVVVVYGVRLKVFSVFISRYAAEIKGYDTMIRLKTTR